MSDIKLFHTGDGAVVELEGQSVAVEKSLQRLMERHLETFLGIRFLASEFSTGPSHGGRIDTLGIDENGSPVIIEYKRAINQNVINQGLFYLDWLMDHKAAFTLQVMQRLGQEDADNIEWGSPRLICVAGDFTKYDEHAIKQMNRNIELIRYRRYGRELLLLELVNATQAQEPGASPVTADTSAKRHYKTQHEYYVQAPQDLQDRFEALSAFLQALGDDVQVKWLKYYIAFRRLKNFATAKVHPQAGTILVWVPLDPDKYEMEDGLTRDVRNIGHHGTGDLEITIASDEDLERAKSFLVKSYEIN
jgi:predicted transport protein